MGGEGILVFCFLFFFLKGACNLEMSLGKKRKACLWEAKGKTEVKAREKMK